VILRLYSAGHSIFDLRLRQLRYIRIFFPSLFAVSVFNWNANALLSIAQPNDPHLLGL